jgi:hypothetical protein
MTIAKADFLFKAHMAGVFLAIGLCANCSLSFAGSSVAEDWERESATQRLPDRSLCSPIDRALIRPTIQSQRPEAIAQLEKLPFIEVDEHRAAILVEAPGSAETSDSAASVIGKAIAELQARKRRELVDHQGSWSLADQDRLDKLELLKKSATLSTLRPFLARAIAKYEFTGAFDANKCGETLWIAHESLGKQTPASIPLPVVVFLNKPPTNVYVSWGMAE